MVLCPSKTKETLQHTQAATGGVITYSSASLSAEAWMKTHIQIRFSEAGQNSNGINESMTYWMMQIFVVSSQWNDHFMSLHRLRSICFYYSSPEF